MNCKCGQEKVLYMFDEPFCAECALGRMAKLDVKIEQLKSQKQTLEKEVELLRIIYNAAKELVGYEGNIHLSLKLSKMVLDYEESRKVE